MNPIISPWMPTHKSLLPPPKVSGLLAAHGALWYLEKHKTIISVRIPFCIYKRKKLLQMGTEAPSVCLLFKILSLKLNYSGDKNINHIRKLADDETYRSFLSLPLVYFFPLLWFRQPAYIPYVLTKWKANDSKLNIENSQEIARIIPSAKKETGILTNWRWNIAG